MTDKIMEHYKALVEFLGNVLGKNCEIALLDLREDKQCITAIANGHISGRTVGSPVTDLALNIVASGSWKTSDCQCNYFGLTKDNRSLRSSTFFIKNDNEILGMLCMNIDDNQYFDIMEKFLHLAGIPDSAIKPEMMEKTVSPCQENFSTSITETIDCIVDNFCAKYQVPVTHLTRSERLALVERLHNNGVFLIKGALSMVAERMQCSEATVYRYLSKLQKSS